MRSRFSDITYLTIGKKKCLDSHSHNYFIDTVKGVFFILNLTKKMEFAKEIKCIVNCSLSVYLNMLECKWRKRIILSEIIDEKKLGKI